MFLFLISKAKFDLLYITKLSYVISNITSTKELLLQSLVSQIVQRMSAQRRTVFTQANKKTLFDIIKYGEGGQFFEIGMSGLWPNSMVGVNCFN